MTRTQAAVKDAAPEAIGRAPSGQPTGLCKRAIHRVKSRSSKANNFG